MWPHVNVHVVQLLWFVVLCMGGSECSMLPFVKDDYCAVGVWQSQNMTCNGHLPIVAASSGPKQGNVVQSA